MTLTSEERKKGQEAKAVDIAADLEPESNATEAFLSQPNKNTTTIPKNQKPRRDGWWWWWEIITATISVLSIIAITAILIYLQDRPLSTWTFTISPNTIISIFTTITKSTLLISVSECLSQSKWWHFRDPKGQPLNELDTFDAASRGPWGSANLLWILKGRRNWIASWGAIVMIFALTADPTAQQILVFPTRRIALGNETAAIGSVRDWGPVDMDTQRLPLEGSILNSVYDLSGGLTVTCPTGDCEWDNFVSLAVCTSCTNVTDRSTVSCIKSGVPNDMPTTNCNVTTARGVNISIAYDIFGAGITKLNASTSYPDSESGILLATVVKTGWLANHTTVKTEGFLPYQTTTFECLFSWCAQRYANVSVKGGIFNPGITKEIALSTPGIDASTGTISLTASYFDIPDMNNTTFTLSHAYYLPRRILKKLLTTTYVIWGGNEGQSLPTGIAEIMSTSNQNSTQDSNSTTSPLNVFQKIATGVTNYLRQSPDSAIEVGRTLSDEVYIHVRWLWLIVPVILVLQTVGLLIGTIFVSGKMAMPLWKSSAVALAFCGVEGLQRVDGENEIRRHEVVNDRARGLIVVLREDGTGSDYFEKVG